ncbi:MAG TPA: dienelactone hydrolase family protein [Sphingobacteriaceae bacterium]
MYTHSKTYINTGLPLTDARQVIIMVHGRGASPEDIIQLAPRLKLQDAAILAPRAARQSWYPYSFLAPIQENQPALGSALELLDSLVSEAVEQGIGTERIFFLGFSQGACLSLEYVTRNGRRYGGVVAFTGGLIGEQLDPSAYQGDFSGTPVLITTGDPDPHVPVARVEETVSMLREMNAEVYLKIYPGRPHTILAEELDLANREVLSK